MTAHATAILHAVTFRSFGNCTTDFCLDLASFIAMSMGKEGVCVDDCDDKKLASILNSYEEIPHVNVFRSFVALIIFH